MLAALEYFFEHNFTVHDGYVYRREKKSGPGYGPKYLVDVEKIIFISCQAEKISYKGETSFSSSNIHKIPKHHNNVPKGCIPLLHVRFTNGGDMVFVLDEEAEDLRVNFIAEVGKS